jgi:hypothetical protein
LRQVKMSLNKGQKNTLPSDQKFAKVLLKHFNTVKKHLLECPQISGLFEDDSDAEDMFEDGDSENEFLQVEAEDDDEEEQVPSEDENIEDDSDEETPSAKPVKKSIEKAPAANGKPATPKAALKAPVAESSDDDEEAEDDEGEDELEYEDESEMEMDLPTPQNIKKSATLSKAPATPANLGKKNQKPTPAASTPATAGKKRPLPTSEPSAFIKKVNLKDEKSLQSNTPPAKKAKTDDSAKAKKPVTSSKFFKEHEEESDDDNEFASADDDDESGDSDDEKKTFPSKKKSDDGQTKGFWKGKVAGDSSEKRGGFMQRGNRGGDRGKLLLFLRLV